MSRVSDGIARLRELAAQRDKLLTELERSIAIRALWPEAFDHGRCSSAWIGVPLRRDQRPEHWGTMIYALRLRVTDGAGNVREFEQTIVPVVLWPMPTLGKLPKGKL